MTPLPRSVIASLQYEELLQTCHELFTLALEANVLSRREAKWYQKYLRSCWDPAWQIWDEYIACCVGYYG